MKLSAGWSRFILAAAITAVAGVGIGSVALKQVDDNKAAIEENKKDADKKIELLRQSIQTQTTVQAEIRTDVKWIKQEIKNGS